MRQSSRQRAIAGGVVRRYRLAPLLAVLALLANQALLPILRFVAGGPLSADIAASVHVASHAGNSHHHVGDRQGDDPQPVGSGHQVCHFCRLLGAALPPPPPAVPVRRAAPASVTLELADTAIRPKDHFRIGRLVRAPPQIV